MRNLLRVHLKERVTELKSARLLLEFRDGSLKFSASVLIKYVHFRVLDGVRSLGSAKERGVWERMLCPR
jgi:hypothetical protein